MVPLKVALIWKMQLHFVDFMHQSKVFDTGCTSKKAAICQFERTVILNLVTIKPVALPSL